MSLQPPSPQTNVPRDDAGNVVVETYLTGHDYRILVIDAGRIVEEGNHHDLLAHGKVYARLYALQFQESPA
jgi:hypothetical protein